MTFADRSVMGFMAMLGMMAVMRMAMLVLLAFVMAALAVDAVALAHVFFLLLNKFFFGYYSVVF